jgi:hypothetical protein
MKALDIPKSGRCRDFVYYMRGKKQCRRRYVIPKDPRTPAQRRVRAALSAASKVWSHSQQLTEEQRQDWRAAGAKVQSRPRLCQAGPLTGQQYFVGRNCARGRTGGEMLLWSPGRGNAATQTPLVLEEGRGQKVEPASQVRQYQRVTQSTWEHHRRAPVGPRRGCGRGTGCARNVECRIQNAEWRRGRGGAGGRGLWGLAEAGRKGQCRELWRGS